MTQEEKARAYEEALERAKTILKRGYYISGDIEVIFPELAESEDERIRNGLCEFLHCTTDEYLFENFSIHKEEAIAWIEKQSKD